MLLTKFGHACVRLEDHDAVLVFDPGAFSDVETALDGADVVLVTHEHPDHIQPEKLIAALRDNAELQVWAPSSVVDGLRDENSDLAERIHTAEPGSAFEAAGFSVRTFGSQHALIHPKVPMVANIGYAVDDNVFHPGDSFTVPDGLEVKTLLVPVHAPLSKVGEVIDFVISVRAPRVFQIHDGLLNETGLGMVENHVRTQGKPYGAQFEHLDVGQSVEV